jgi:hypothetical protein
MQIKTMLSSQSTLQRTAFKMSLFLSSRMTLTLTKVSVSFLMFYRDAPVLRTYQDRVLERCI